LITDRLHSLFRTSTASHTTPFLRGALIMMAILNGSGKELGLHRRYEERLYSPFTPQIQHPPIQTRVHTRR
jgi:hypothetical protein